MTDKLSQINPKVNSPPLHVKNAADDTLRQKGISSVVEHHDPGFFKTRIFTLCPPLRTLHAFPFPDLDSLLEAHLKKRWGAQWDTFTPDIRLKCKRDLAGSARNWNDLIYQVVLENLDQFQGLTQDQKERLKSSPLFREEFCDNSPLNGQSYLAADGTRIDLTHAGSCPKDRASEKTHMLRRIAYHKSNESLYYTGRPETQTKALEQATWMFQREKGCQGKGITSNPDSSVTFTYLVNSMADSGYWENLDGKREFLNEEVATLKALQGHTITIDGQRVHLNPILVHQQYGISATAEKCTPAWFSGKKLSDEIMSENLPLLKAYALQVKKNLQQKYPTASLKEQKELLKKIRHIDTALQKLDDYNSLPPDERLFYLALLSRMMNIPLTIYSKDHAEGAGKLITALYTWLDADMPDDFSRIIGNKSSKGDHLRKLFDTLVTGHLMAAHQVSRYGNGAEGVIDGEQLDADRMGLDIRESPPIIDHLPERYTQATPLLFCFKAFVFFIGALFLEICGIIGATLELVFSTICPILFVYWIIKYHEESEKFWDHYLYLSRNVFSTLHKDIFRIFSSLIAVPSRGIDATSPYVQARQLLKPLPSTEMTLEAQKLLAEIDGLNDTTYSEMLAYLKQETPELLEDTPNRQALIDLGRAAPLLNRMANRSDFNISPKARTLIEAFGTSKKTDRDQLEYLPEHEFRHLQDFILNEKGSNQVLSSRQLIAYQYLTDNDTVLSREAPTMREAALFQTLALSARGDYSLQRINFIEQSTYKNIVTCLREGNLSSLTSTEQKVALTLLERIRIFRTTAADQENLSDREQEILQLLNDDKIAELLLKEIDLLSREESHNMITFLQNTSSRESTISPVLQLLFNYLELVLSKAKQLNNRQQIILEGLAAFSSKNRPFSIDHITHLNEAQYKRLLARFKDPNSEDLTDQNLLEYIVLSSEQLFEQAQHSKLSSKQQGFLETLALTPYGKFTLARLERLPTGQLPPLAQGLLVRDLPNMLYETRLTKPTEKQQILLDQAQTYSRTFIGKLIDELSEKKYEELLQSLRNPQPAPTLFTAEQKRLLLLLANHGDQIPLTNPRRRSLMQACKNSHLFLFQIQRLTAPDSVKCSADKFSTAETLADWAYTIPQNEQVNSLDDKTTFVVGDQFEKDIHRSSGIQFAVGNNLMPNPVDDSFRLSETLLKTPEGLLFLQKLKSGLKELGIEALYDSLVVTLHSISLRSFVDLLQEQNFHERLGKSELSDFTTSLPKSKLKQLIEGLKKSLFVDLLFNSLKTLAPFRNMEQLPPILQDNISQSGRNYGMGMILHHHLVGGISTFSSPLQPTAGDLWRIHFNASDERTTTVDYSTDFNLFSVEMHRSLGKIFIDYQQHCTNTETDPLWKSQLVPQNLRIVFSPIFEDDQDLLFTTFTSPTSDDIVPQQTLVTHLKRCISEAKKSSQTSGYFKQRITENLALLKPLISLQEYRAFMTNLGIETE